MHAIATSRALALCTAALFFPGCDEDDDPDGVSVDVKADETLDSAEINERWAALSTGVDTSVESVAGPSDAANGAGGFACQGGGTAQVDGLVDVQVSPLRIDVDADIGFDGCGIDSQTRLSGDVHVSQSVAAGAGEAVRVETIYTGSVDFEDDAGGSCDVDVQVLVDIDGRLVSVDGTFCGLPATDLQIAVTPHWRA
jgi:hypothetical protein